MLDKRLRCVAGLVRPGSVLADIGTDHAHLPVWLVKEGVCPRAVAADIRIGPAAAAVVPSRRRDWKSASTCGWGTVWHPYAPARRTTS